MSGATTKLNIRPAVEDDLAAIMGIYNWAVNQTFATLDAEPLDREEAVEWWLAHGSKSLLLVAEGEEGVIGWGRLLSWARRGLSSTVEDLVYVDPLLQGKGVGKALLGSLLDEAAALDYRLMVAQVAAGNRGGRALHEALGFREVGVLHQASYKFNQWIDVTLMERQLEKP
jgi:L-amino acid N-acyltransferase YncA